jgi:hypothetical protein
MSVPIPFGISRSSASFVVPYIPPRPPLKLNYVFRRFKIFCFPATVNCRLFMSDKNLLSDKLAFALAVLPVALIGNVPAGRSAGTSSSPLPGHFR